MCLVVLSPEPVRAAAIGGHKEPALYPWPSFSPEWTVIKWKKPRDKQDRKSIQVWFGCPESQRKILF